MNLTRAIEIAVVAHAGQTDKAGNPYILHPLRVMLALDSEEERIVGVLHDVVEDCGGWTFERLRAEGFSEEVLEALQAVTKSDDDADYDAFVTRASGSRIGRRVKMADIRDNLDITRLGDITDRDVERLRRYKRALSMLL